VAGVAVAASAGGLLPISQQAIFPLSSLGYHDYEGVALRDDEKPRLVQDLGDRNYLILRNHGLLTAGPTIADAFLFMYVFERACQVQVAAQVSRAPLLPIGADILESASAQARVATATADSRMRFMERNTYRSLSWC
jgi:ribulose-5-phosphate 4-epimerase/fuculose-1-phosphate aldolase